MYSLKPDYDATFEKHEDKFLKIPLRDWPKKVKEFETEMTIKDASSVDAYLKTL